VALKIQEVGPVRPSIQVELSLTDPLNQWLEIISIASVSPRAAAIQIVRLRLDYIPYLVSKAIAVSLA
jgi:hypothetical protein